jgi:hypothetical protein
VQVKQRTVRLGVEGSVEVGVSGEGPD